VYIGTVCGSKDTPVDCHYHERQTSDGLVSLGCHFSEVINGQGESDTIGLVLGMYCIICVAVSVCATRRV